VEICAFCYEEKILEYMKRRTQGEVNILLSLDSHDEIVSLPTVGS